MTITLANVVLPEIRARCRQPTTRSPGVVILDLIATAVATPTTGWLESRWRDVMFRGVGGFTLFSLLCGRKDVSELNRRSGKLSI
jgi:DHA2 family multidrug resistance protein